MRGRYAPSPTGPQHLGNLRTALLAWLIARLSGAEFVIRMEDIDIPRTRPGSAEAILEDLKWLDLDWDNGPTTLDAADPWMQTSRTHLYERALEFLKAQDLVYPCWCTRREIQEASAPHERGALYPGTCARLDEAGRAKMARERPDRQPAWRLRVGPEDGPNIIKVHDQILGTLEQDLVSEVGDQVLLRSDGLWAYQLAVVVDDLEMGVTQIVRGEDLFDSTPRQVWLAEILKSEFNPDFEGFETWHVPLVLDQNGERMAKRNEAAQVDRNQPPERVIGQLIRTLGWDFGDISASDLLRQISLESIRKL